MAPGMVPFTALPDQVWMQTEISKWCSSAVCAVEDTGYSTSLLSSRLWRCHRGFITRYRADAAVIGDSIEDRVMLQVSPHVIEFPGQMGHVQTWEMAGL